MAHADTARGHLAQRIEGDTVHGLLLPAGAAFAGALRFRLGRRY